MERRPGKTKSIAQSVDRRSRFEFEQSSVESETSDSEHSSQESSEEDVIPRHQKDAETISQSQTHSVSAFSWTMICLLDRSSSVYGLFYLHFSRLLKALNIFLMIRSHNLSLLVLPTSGIPWRCTFHIIRKNTCRALYTRKINSQQMEKSWD